MGTINQLSGANSIINKTTLSEQIVSWLSTNTDKTIFYN